MLDDYLGEFSYLGTTLRSLQKEGQPSTWDIKQMLTLYGILPLGSETVHENSPLVKSVLLTGPPGCGKKLLVQAMANEVGANLFDLTPENLVGKYPGKSGLKMLIHMVWKVAEIFQPSIIHIGNAEKTFYKKVPKAEKPLDPKRIKKDLPKQMKEVKAGKRILLVGTSSAPFEADIKSFCKVYDKIVMVPRPCYGDRKIIIERRIYDKLEDVQTTFIDFSSLAKMTDGYATSQIIQVINNTINERRLNQVGRKPIKTEEFIVELAALVPIFAEQEDAFTQWFEKTPIGKKRKKILVPDEAGDGGKGGGKKGKGGGKKKKK